MLPHVVDELQCFRKEVNCKGGFVDVHYSIKIIDTMMMHGL